MKVAHSPFWLVPKLRLGNPYLASSGLAVLREAGTSKTLFPSRSFTAIKLSVYRNAKPQLGIGNLPAKLGLSVPSRADFTLNVSLNLMTVKQELGNEQKPRHFGRDAEIQAKDGN